MKIVELLIAGKNQLKTYSPTADLDIEIILSSLLKIEKNNLFFIQNNIIDDENVIQLFWRYVNQRKSGKPIAKIFNRKYFWKSEFFVNENVLDPRTDSETLIELVIEEYKNKQYESYKILDLGTGSGCLVLSLLQEFQNSTAVAVDISSLAIQVAKQNSNKLNLNSRIKFIQSNWNDNISDKFDIIVSNPPYIKTNDINNLSNDVKNFDPMLALDGGVDGLNCYRYLAENLHKNCHRDTKIFLEISHNQKNQVRDIFENNNFIFIRCKKDLNRQDRIIQLEIDNNKCL